MPNSCRSLALLFILQASVCWSSSTPNCISQNPYSLSSPPDCLTCDPGYVLKQNTSHANNPFYCYSCSENCQSCNIAGPSKCDTCPQGYVLNPTSQTCEPCSANCTQCNSWGRGTCDPLMCQAGYGHLSNDYLLNASDSACGQCSDINCVSCFNDRVGCVGCVSGFALYQNNGTCFKCPQYCQACSISGWEVPVNGESFPATPVFSCTSCLAGYAYDSLTQTCKIPTQTVTNSTGVIITVVLSVFLIIGTLVLGFYMGKRRALQSQ